MAGKKWNITTNETLFAHTLCVHKVHAMFSSPSYENEVLGGS